MPFHRYLPFLLLSVLVFAGCSTTSQNADSQNKQSITGEWHAGPISEREWASPHVPADVRGISLSVNEDQTFDATYEDARGDSIGGFQGEWQWSDGEGGKQISFTTSGGTEGQAEMTENSVLLVHAGPEMDFRFDRVQE